MYALGEQGAGEPLHMNTGWIAVCICSVWLPNRKHEKHSLVERQLLVLESPFPGFQSQFPPADYASRNWVESCENVNCWWNRSGSTSRIGHNMHSCCVASPIRLIPMSRKSSCHHTHARTKMLCARQMLQGQSATARLRMLCQSQSPTYTCPLDSLLTSVEREAKNAPGSNHWHTVIPILIASQGCVMISSTANIFYVNWPF